MQRAGFTMIELIFVIVILGILSAVAVPKMMGMSEKADASVCKSYYGTLNRTVGPNLWANMSIDDKNASEAFATTEIEKQIKTPANGKCGSIDDISKAATDGTDFTVDIGGTTYDINATQATKEQAPTWNFHKK